VKQKITTGTHFSKLRIPITFSEKENIMFNPNHNLRIREHQFFILRNFCEFSLKERKEITFNFGPLYLTEKKRGG